MVTSTKPPSTLKAPPPPISFKVGWICALKEEYHAAVRILDEQYDTTGLIRSHGDKNHYNLGRVGAHNVMISLPPTEMHGQNHASEIAINMRNTFPTMRFVLLVGIAAGVPSPKHEIRLGDVVLGTRAVPYAFGKETDHGFERTGEVQKAPRELLKAITLLEERIWSEDVRLSEAIECIRTKPTGDGTAFLRPTHDRFYQSGFIHQELGCDCLRPVSQQRANMYSRADREGDLVRVFEGGIGSDNHVIKNARVRDDIAKRENVLCFDMEAAGVMDVVPCLPIKGISNYADGHKNDDWSLYAALAAATCARELLLSISPQFVAEFPVTIAGNILDHYIASAVNRNAFSGNGMENLRHAYRDLTKHPALLGDLFPTEGLQDADKTPYEDIQGEGDRVQRSQVSGPTTKQHNALPLGQGLNVRK